MPLPFNTPVILVVTVMAGVELAVATVPVNPFALTTLTVVTVPLPETVPQLKVVPFVVKYFPVWPD